MRLIGAVAWMLLALGLGGCAIGHAAPGYVKCKGKGVITGNGAGSMAAIYGAGGLNAFTLSMDCGDGLEFEQGKVLTPPAAPVK